MQTISYRCTQQEVYISCRAGAKSCKDNLSFFAAFSPIYTDKWLEQFLQKVADAEALPNAQLRNSAAELKRVELEENAQIATNLWQTLKRYSTKAYPNPEVLKIKLDTAGAAYYEKAANQSWKDLTTLMSSANMFIQDNLSDLKPGTIIPTDFPDIFKDSKDNCKQIFDDFIQLQEAEKINTENKIKANNEIYSILIEMFKDGQAIFKGQEETVKQFIFDEVLALISTSTTGLKGKIVAAVTNAPIPGTTITSNDEKYQTQTDEAGQYAFHQITAGQHGFKVEKAGYGSQEFLIELDLGVTKTQNLTLQPA